MAGIDEFLDQVTVLPPGEWDPSIRIEPPKNVPSQVNLHVTSPVNWSESAETLHLSLCFDASPQGSAPSPPSPPRNISSITCFSLL